MLLEALPLDKLNTNIDKPSLHEKHLIFHSSDLQIFHFFPAKRQTLHSPESLGMKKIVISQLYPLDGVKQFQEKCIKPKFMVKECIHFKGNANIYRHRTGYLAIL